MPKKEWTAEERQAFGEKMAAARAAKAATTGDTEMATSGKQFAGREDVPAGVRPIAERPAVLGREVAPESVGGLIQTADTGFAASSEAAIEVSSHEVIGGNVSVNRPAAQASAPKPGGANAVLFSDAKDDGGLPRQLQRSQGRTGSMEPTGLPCSCAYELDGSRRVDEKGHPKGMATLKRGQDAKITWCAVCGGERDGIARPENALRSTAASAALLARGVQIDMESVAQRAAGLIDYELLAAMVAAKLKEQ